MSNPGVVLLSESLIVKHQVKIEDNLGESIHVHYDDIRFDMSIKDYLRFESSVKQALVGLLDVKEFDANGLEEDFWDVFGAHILDLQSVSKDSVSPRNLRYLTRSGAGRYLIRDLKSYKPNVKKIGVFPLKHREGVVVLLGNSDVVISGKTEAFQACKRGDDSICVDRYYFKESLSVPGYLCRLKNKHMIGAYSRYTKKTMKSFIRRVFRKTATSYARIRDGFNLFVLGR